MSYYPLHHVAQYDVVTACIRAANRITGDRRGGEHGPVFEKIVDQ